MKNTMGYGLNAFVDHEDPIDILVHLMVGSEGTLGFVAEAVFRTVEVLPHVATGLLVFGDVESATSSVPRLIDAGTVTAELMDAASLKVSSADPRCPAVIRDLDVDRHAALLVEFEAETAEQLVEQRRTRRAGPGGARPGRTLPAHHGRRRAGVALADPQGPVQRGRQRASERHQRPARGRRRTGGPSRADLRRAERAVRRPPLRGVGDLRPRAGRQRALPAQGAVRRRRATWSATRRSPTTWSTSSSARAGRSRPSTAPAGSWPRSCAGSTATSCTT